LETADEIIKNLFRENNEIVVGDRLPSAEESTIELDEVKKYIKSLEPNKSPDPDGSKVEMYQGTSNITASK